MSVRAHPVGALGRFLAVICSGSRAAWLTIYGGEKGRSPVSSLTELEMRILAFERSLWRTPGAKEREILDAIGITPTRYYQLLNELIDRPAAAEFDPALVARLRRRRTVRGKVRSAD